MNMLKQRMAPAQALGECSEADRGRSCLAGLYLLTNDGVLARFDAAGELSVDTEFTETLSFRLRAVLDQYRSGALEALSLGLIADTEFERQWQIGTLVFSDRALNELFETGRAPDMPLTAYEQRNKSKTVYQGMELLLNKTRPLQPLVPTFCPVLVVPNVGCDTLRERYGIDMALEPDFYEVLDLSAPFSSHRLLPRELLSMAQNMRRTQRVNVSTGGSGSAFDGPAAPGAQGGPAAARSAAVDVLEPAASCFNDGDAVTGWLLEWFSPFNELTDMQREIIAGYETVRKVKAGTCLIEKGTLDDACIYLVEGSLELADPDGDTMVIKAGTRRSRLPISVLTPHGYDVSAVTDVSYIQFSQTLVRKVIEIATTYTSVDPLQEPDASTTAISNGVQALYLKPAYPALAARSETG